MKFILRTTSPSLSLRRTIMKALTFGVALGGLSVVGVSFFVSLPWSLIIAACITFNFDE